MLSISILDVSIEKMVRHLEHLQNFDRKLLKVLYNWQSTDWQSTHTKKYYGLVDLFLTDQPRTHQAKEDQLRSLDGT